MEVYVFRHGDSKYTQGIVFPSKANDLTDFGITAVAKSSEHLANKLKKSIPVQIYSSPFGRCLYTAKIIEKVLKKSGLKIEGIDIDESIGEVKNFEWSLFYPLVVGGKIEYEREKFLVDSNLTNPKKVGFAKYFRKDFAHQLSKRAKKSLPKQYLERIASFERCPFVLKRFDSKLEQLMIPNRISIISTHDGLIGRFIEQLSGNENSFLDRGKYFLLRHQNGIWVPYNLQKGAILSE